VVGQIVVDGNVRVSDAAFFSNLRLKKGDAYDEAVVRREFKRLWDMDLFDDIAVESRRRADGSIDLIFHVRDRPLLGSITYTGMKAISETSILERLQQGKAEIRRGQPVDFTTLRKAESLIGHMLAEKGYLDARVRAHLGPVGQGQRDVTFDIHEGAKTKIKHIEFVGNTVFTDAELRKTLKLTKQAFWLTSWASSKPLYHPAKFDQDVESIRTAYRSRGYLDIQVQPEVVEVESEAAKAAHPAPQQPGAPQPPRLTSFDPMMELNLEDEPAEEPAPPPPGETEKQKKKRLEKEHKEKAAHEAEKKRWVFLTVPIQEGRPYKLGSLDVDGNAVFSKREVLSRFPLRSGMVYNDSLVKAATKRLEDDYGERGFFYVSIDPQVKKHDGVADLTLEVTEDKKYFVDRIDFSGNNSTRDAVLRREMRLGEQQLFNVKLMRLGVRKISQLGYWQVQDDPVVTPEQDTGKVHIEVQGTESSRNEIQVGGGVSGLDGGFFQGSYSTRNFMGKGEVFSAFLQTGQRGSRYALNFTEPWFLGHPWSLGFSLFRRDTVYTGYNTQGQGGSINFGRILGAFSRFDVAYTLEDITYKPTSIDFGTLDTTTTTSSIVTLYTFDTRNNFFRPTHGVRTQSSVEYAGGFLGGDNNFAKFRQDATLFLPGLFRRNYVALNMSTGYVMPINGATRVPQYERYYLGGERSLRMYRTRSVGPIRSDKDLNGNGIIDTPEDSNHNGILDPSEDKNGNGILDTEDKNHNGILDPGEDLNGNGILDTEDTNHNGFLDFGEDRPDGRWTPYCPADDPNMNGVRDAGEGDHGNCKLDPGEDTNGDGIYGTVLPGGDKYVQFNVEYAMPVSDTVEFVVFYDAGNAFDNGVSPTLTDLKADYGLELRFYLPIFQAPLRLIYGFIENPLPGENNSNFIFSIGTTF
jgi:outer membrane protein insertion porin family